MGRLVINGEEVYELDETCLKEKRGQNNQLRDRYRYAEHLEGNQASESEEGTVTAAGQESADGQATDQENAGGQVAGDADTEDGKDEGGIFKEESVYVKADAAGNVNSTTVTEWLKNLENGELEDTSDLKDIKNSYKVKELISKKVEEERERKNVSTKEIYTTSTGQDEF